MELDFAIDRTGNVHPSHQAVYEALGDWIKACYGSPLATNTSRATTVTATLPTAIVIDRVVLAENIAEGQRVRNFTVAVQLGASTWTTVGNGHSIGNKRIVLFSKAVTATAVRVTMAGSAGEPEVTINAIASATCA